MSEKKFPCVLPLSDDLLRKYNFFELYPLDGGGFFITRELFGTLDDAKIAETILNGHIMDEFGSLDNIDFSRYEKWRTIEKSCWINRCYFLVPLAKTAWLNNDAVSAGRIMRIILNFFRNFPPPEDLQSHWERVERRMQEDYNSKSYEEICRDETDVEYIWFDMQVGQRLICMLYAGYFIYGSPAVSDEQRSELLECLRTHALVLARQEMFQQPYLDNHQSLRAIALYMALPLLQGTAEYDRAAQLAGELCSYHILNEFLESGMLFEYSPSYQAFVLWHARDFRNLARMRNEAVAPEVDERIQAAIRALCCLTRPDGLSLTINDSYQFKASALLASLGKDVELPQHAVLNPGGVAVARRGKNFVAVDASGFIGKFSHYHGGKNSPVVFLDNEVFLEESGCPSYDKEEFLLCKKPLQHSTLLVDGIGDTHQFGLYGFDAWAELKHDNQWQLADDGSCSFSAIATSNAPEWAHVCWQRICCLSAEQVKFTDRITAADAHEYTLLFCLAPGVSVEPCSDGWMLSKNSVQVLLKCSLGNGKVTEIKNCQQHSVRTACQLQFSCCGQADTEIITELIIKK